jgi:hypothetical protein
MDPPPRASGSASCWTSVALERSKARTRASGAPWRLPPTLLGDRAPREAFAHPLGFRAQGCAPMPRIRQRDGPKRPTCPPPCVGQQHAHRAEARSAVTALRVPSFRRLALVLLCSCAQDEHTSRARINAKKIASGRAQQKRRKLKLRERPRTHLRPGIKKYHLDRFVRVRFASRGVCDLERKKPSRTALRLARWDSKRYRVTVRDRGDHTPIGARCVNTVI